MSLVLQATRLEPAAWRFVAHMAFAAAVVLLLSGSDVLASMAAFSPR